MHIGPNWIGFPRAFPLRRSLRRAESQIADRRRSGSRYQPCVELNGANDILRTIHVESSEEVECVRLRVHIPETEVCYR